MKVYKLTSSQNGYSKILTVEWVLEQSAERWSLKAWEQSAERCHLKEEEREAKRWCSKEGEQSAERCHLKEEEREAKRWCSKEGEQSAERWSFKEGGQSAERWSFKEEGIEAKRRALVLSKELKALLQKIKNTPAGMHLQKKYASWQTPAKKIRQLAGTCEKKRKL